MEDVNYLQVAAKQCRSGMVDNDLFSLRHTVLPGVHEIIPHENHLPSPPWDSNNNKPVTLNPNPTYMQTPYPDVQYQNRFPSDVYSNSNRLVSRSEHLVYQPDRPFPFPFAYPLQENLEVNRSWLNSQFPHVNAVGSSQWMSNSSTSSKLPGLGYGTGPGGTYGLEMISTHQTRVLGPIQQPYVQPTPPCFWVDRFKSQSLHPLPRPVCSTLGNNLKPQNSHVGCYSHFKPCVCSDCSVNSQVSHINTDTINSRGCGQPSYKNSLLYGVPGVNKASIASQYPHQTTATHFGQVPSSTVSFRNLLSYPSDCTDRSVNKNDLLIDRDEQKTLLDENCNHTFKAAAELHSVIKEERVDDKFEEEPELSLDEDDLSSSMIEEYIQNAPDFHSLSQIELDQSSLSQMNLDQSELVISRMDQTESHHVSKSEVVRKDTKVVIPQTEDIQSHYSEIRKSSTSISDSMTTGKANLFHKDCDSIVCSSSSSEVSPVTTSSKSNIQTSTRRRSYRSRNFSKEFCNRWSSFEDVPLVISRKPNCKIVCSTPKRVDLVENALTEKKYKCEICSKGFYNHYAYSRHLKRHKIDAENNQRNQTPSKNMYRCSACNMTWFNRELFISHSRHHMNEVQKSSYTGQIQNLACKENTTELGLFSKEKGRSFVRSSGHRFVCRICNDSFSSYYEYNLHCAKHQETDDEIISSNESDSSPSSPVFFSCSVCNVKFVNRFMYSKHCVSKEHRIMQKHGETGIQKSGSSKLIVHEKPAILNPDKGNESKLSFIDNPISADSAKQSISVLKYQSKDCSENYLSGSQNKSVNNSDLVKNDTSSGTEIDKRKLLKCGCPSVSVTSKVKLQLEGLTLDKDITQDSHSRGVSENHSLNNCPYCMVMKKPSLRGTLTSSELPSVVESLDEKSKLISCLVGKHFSEHTQPRHLFPMQVKCCYSGSECSAISEKLSQIKLSSDHLLTCCGDETFSKDTVLKTEVDANNNVTDITTKSSSEMDILRVSLAKTETSSFHGFYNPSVISSNITVVKNSTENSKHTSNLLSTDDHSTGNAYITKNPPLAASSSSCSCGSSDLSVPTKSLTSAMHTSLDDARDVCQTVNITGARKTSLLKGNMNVKDKKRTRPLQKIRDNMNFDCQNGRHVVFEGKRKSLELKNIIPVKHITSVKHYIPASSDKNFESDEKLHIVTGPGTTVNEDVFIQQTNDEFQSPESKMATNDSGLQTDDSGLETGSDVISDDKLQGNSFNDNDESNPDESASCQQNGITKSDIVKRSLINDPDMNEDSNKTDYTKYVELELKVLQSVKTKQEDGNVLKGDSGLWSSDEIFISELEVDGNVLQGSEVEGNVLHSNTLEGNVLHSNRVEKNVLHSSMVEGNALKSNREEQTKHSDAMSEIWSIEIVDCSDKDCKTYLEDSSLISSKQMGLANESNTVTFEVEYDASSNSVNLIDNQEQVARNNWKVISDFVTQSSDFDSEFNSTPFVQSNLQNVVSENKMSDQEGHVSNDDKNKLNFVCQSSLPLSQFHSERKNMANTDLLLDDIYDSGKIYFCEICGETFVNPFRFSAHYKKKAHVELASDFYFENVTHSKTLKTKKREKLQKMKSLRLEKSYKRVKNLKNSKKSVVEKRRKQLSKTNVSFDFGSGLVGSLKGKQKMEKNAVQQVFKNSPLDHRKRSKAFKRQLMLKNKVLVKNMKYAEMSQNGFQQVKRWSGSGKLKKMASSKRLRRLRSASTKNVSKPLHRLPYRNRFGQIKCHNKPVNMIAKKSFDVEKKPIVCSCCSCPFVTNKDLQLHTCPRKRKTKMSVDKIQRSNKMDGHSEKQFRETGCDLKKLDKDRDLLKVSDKDSEILERGLQYEPPLKKRKSVVKCSALLKLLTATDEQLKKEYNVISSSPNVSECVPCRLKFSSHRSRKRHLSCTEHRKCSRSRSSSHIEGSELGKHVEIARPSTSFTDPVNVMHHTKKMKLSSVLANHAEKDHSKRKLSNGRGHGAHLKNKPQAKAVKTRPVKKDVYCDVCDKTYSSKSHLNRHFGTEIHKQQLLEKNKQRKLE